MPDVHRNNLAHIMRRARREAGLSQEGLARRTGISRSAVKRWESGESRPTVEILMTFCQAINIDPADVVTQLTELQKANTQTG